MAEELSDWKWLPKAKQLIEDKTAALINNERQYKSQYKRFTPDPEKEYILDQSYKRYAHRHAQRAGLQGDAQAHDMLPYPFQGDQPAMEFDYQLDVIDESIAQFQWHEEAIEEHQDYEEHEWQEAQQMDVDDNPPPYAYPAHGEQWHEHYGPRDEPPLEAGDWRMHYDRTGKWISDAHLGDFDF